jgi:NADPH:quinone reductase-like Zn-dependent oxidoreductase
MPENSAFWLPSKRADLVVGSAPHPAPRENEIVVRVRVVAVNPMDRLMQSVASVITPYIRHPFVLVSDRFGERISLKLTP